MDISSYLNSCMCVKALAVEEFYPHRRLSCGMVYHISVLFCRDSALQFTRQEPGHVIFQTKSLYMPSLTLLLAHYCGILWVTLSHLDHLRR